jgi:predicted DNA-binding WGR domain protein
LDAQQNFGERFGMANVPELGSAPVHIVLERVNPSKNVARYYVLSIEPTLFAKDTLIRRWGRIGSAGRERRHFFDSESAAELALEMWLARKRKRGYAPTS